MDALTLCADVRQAGLIVRDNITPIMPAGRAPFLRTLADQVEALRRALAAMPELSRGLRALHAADS
jgi:hypothetical protein